MKMEQSVPKSRNIKFRRRAIWHVPAYEDGTVFRNDDVYNSDAGKFDTYLPMKMERVFRNVGIQNLDAGEFYTYLPMKMGQTECSETSAYKI